MGNQFQRVVIKVGTSTLTDGRGMLDRAYFSSLADQINSVKSQGVEVLLVTSGAIRAGAERMGLRERPKTIPEKQAAAAVGQNLLMQIYSEVFAAHGTTVAQILLTRDDFCERNRYLNARNTMLELVRRGAIPVINENDTVSVDEIRVGDNDNLAALVASSLEADLLLLLSDVPGLCTEKPGRAESELIPVVKKIDEKIYKIAGGAGTCGGTGGMLTKIQAAEIAVRSGVTMVIADGRKPGIIGDTIAGIAVGTKFHPAERRLRGRKRWIAFGAYARGGIQVNEGAKKMIAEGGKSLLAAGIIGVTGSFSAGDMVRLLDEAGNPFARGFVNYNDEETRRIMGRKSSEIESILGYKDFDEVIHRDNLVVK